MNDEEIIELEHEFQHELPPQVRAFYSSMNGVQLFEWSLNINGLVGDLLDRTWDIRKPFCPRVDVGCFPGFYAGWHKLGYFPIGSLVGFSRKAIIACGGEGDVVVIEEGSGTSLRRYATLVSALGMLVAELAAHWTPLGKLIGPEEHLDHIFLAAGTA